MNILAPMKSSTRRTERCMTEYNEPEAQVLTTLLSLSSTASFRGARRGISMQLVYHLLHWSWNQSEAERVVENLARRRLVIWVSLPGGDVRTWPLQTDAKAQRQHRSYW
jgi:hypothetical protein